MKGTICCEEKCTACMACANACPKNAIGIGVNKYGYEKVVINDDKCVDCGLCTKVCARRMQDRTAQSNQMLCRAIKGC